MEGTFATFRGNKKTNRIRKQSHEPGKQIQIINYDKMLIS